MELATALQILADGVQTINNLNLGHKLVLNDIHLIVTSELPTAQLANTFYFSNYGKLSFKIYLATKVLEQANSEIMTRIIYHELAHCLQVKELLKRGYLAITISRINILKQFEIHGDIWKQYAQMLSDNLKLDISEFINLLN